MAKSDIQAIIEGLHPLERAVVPFLKDALSVPELAEKSGKKDIEVMRALQWLQNKEVLIINTAEAEIIELDKNGKRYASSALPEKKFLEALRDGKEKTLGEIQKIAGLEKDELGVCIGLLKKKLAITMGGQSASITVDGKKILISSTLEEKFIKSIAASPRELSILSPEERFAFEELRKRRQIVILSVKKTKTITLTELGKKISTAKLSESSFVDRLTPEMLHSGSWKNKKFRKYDVSINVPQISGGKRHFVNQAGEVIRNVWLEMGFTEMSGPLLNTSFWNFDALFTAQDHPVRELQDTFYIKDPATGKLPDQKLVNAVKQMHESGSQGSRGWGYKWDPANAMKNVLRTHTTVLSARTIAGLKKEDLPAKFFSVARCFRNEALDWKHLFELTQVEGIVVDPDANFRNLLAYLREFFTKIGYEKVRIRPAYFPYTEPSAEVEVFHPVKKQWVELGGAGIFRPEVVIPLLGKDIPVLAWGMGFERSISEYFKITDIRQLYLNDLKQVKNMKMWVK